MAKAALLAFPAEPETPLDKIRTVEQLKPILNSARHKGQTVVHAHGTFDLLHIGHVRHLGASRKLGDVLVVTLTADQFVNKGPGRPVFGEGLRAEILANLECVDWVAVNFSSDAVSAINVLCPDIYAKGKDYQNPEGDVTGKIKAERQAVEAHGGRIHFTDEIEFSSTALVNRHLNIFEPLIREHLKSLRDDGGLETMLGLIDSVREYRVVLVGDTIIDEYQYTVPMGKPPKESIIAARYQDQEIFAGGVLAAANHVAAFCKQVDVVTCFGEEFEELIRRSLRPNVMLHAIKRGPTTVKKRFVDPSCMRKLFEVYSMDDEPLTDGLRQSFDSLISDVVPAADVVIAADFGHGLLEGSSIQALSERSRFLAVNTQSNTANMGYNRITKYPRADYICIDAPEAHLAVNDRVLPIGDVARLLSQVVECPKVIITHGKYGCVTFERGGIVHTIPAFARNVVDTVGAGDAFLSVTAPLVAAGGVMEHVGLIGNVIGAMKVEIVGHRQSVEKSAVIKWITALLK